MLDPQTSALRARVAFNLQPERVFSEQELRAQKDPRAITDQLIRQGMRAVLESSNFVTGQKDISLQYIPNAGPAELGQEGPAMLLPSQSGGIDGITTSLADITAKLDRIPFDDIGQNL